MSEETAIQSNKSSRVRFDRIEVGVLGNVRKRLTNIKELAGDIRERGLLQPMVVWHKKFGGDSPFELPSGEKVFNRYILIAGNRRHAAVSLLREEDPTAFEELNVTLFHGTVLDARCAQLAENLAREDLTPVEVMDAVYALSQENITQNDIAKRLAKTQGWVSRLLKVRENCIEEVIKELAEGSISMDAAYDLASLDQEKQAAALIEHTKTSHTNGKSAARKATRKAAGKAVRPGVKEIKARWEKYEDSNAKMAPTVRKVLSWVLGEGDWL